MFAVIQPDRRHKQYKVLQIRRLCFAVRNGSPGACADRRAKPGAISTKSPCWVAHVPQLRAPFGYQAAGGYQAEVRGRTRFKGEKVITRQASAEALLQKRTKGHRQKLTLD